MTYASFLLPSHKTRVEFKPNHIKRPAADATDKLFEFSLLCSDIV